MKAMPRIFGYMENGEPHPVESEIVQYIFKKYIAYSENPPEILVQEIINIYKEEYNQNLSYDEAKKMVNGDSIKELILKEVKEIWKDYFDTEKKKNQMNIGIENPSDYEVNEIIKKCLGEDSILYARNNRLWMNSELWKGKVNKQNEPIIDEETYIEAQKAIKNDCVQEVPSEKVDLELEP